MTIGQWVPVVSGFEMAKGAVPRWMTFGFWKKVGFSSPFSVRCSAEAFVRQCKRAASAAALYYFAFEITC